MVSMGYAWNELRRRWSRTLVTAIGLAAGVGLVMGIVGVSNGLEQAQNKVLSPLSSVGTDIIVTRTVGATTAPTSAAGTTPGSTTTTTPATGAGAGAGAGGFFRNGGAGGGGRGGAGGATSQIDQLNADDQAALLNANSSILTDLSKLGPPGTAFTHDFFVPGTLITFPQEAVTDIKKVDGVTAAVPALTLQALHESGTVPATSDTFTTGGQTITSVARPAPLTAAEQASVRSCLQASGAFPTTPTTGAAGAGAGAGGTGAGAGAGGPGRQGGGGGGNLVGRFGAAFTQCLPQRFQQYESQVVVPTQTITRVLNPPATDTQTKTYTVAGIDPTNEDVGLITKAQVKSGSWFSAKPANEILVNTAYASTNKIKTGQTLTIDDTKFTVVGLVDPTLTGNTADIYFDLATLQKLSNNTGRANEVSVKVNKSSDVTAVGAAIHKQLPGAQVLTSKSLADQVSGSLSNAHTLATNLGGALAVIVLLAAFLIAALLTLSSVAKRVREIGTLRAVGWSKSAVVRQIVTETVGIGILGGVLGVIVGIGICSAIGAFGPALSSTTSGTAVGASTAGSLFHQATAAASTTTIHLTAPISFGTALLGLAAAIVGGLLAGIVGGWRAARLAPASAMRDLG